MTTNPLRWILFRTWHIRFQISRPIICFTVATYPSRTNNFIFGSVSWSISSPHPEQANRLNSLIPISGSTNRSYLQHIYPLFIISLQTIPCLIHGTTHSTYTIWQNLESAYMLSASLFNLVIKTPLSISTTLIVALPHLWTKFLILVVTMPLSPPSKTSFPVQKCAQALYHFRLLCIPLPHTTRFRTLIIKLSIQNFPV